MTKVSRLFWLFNSAELSFIELIYIVVNKFIFSTSKLYYFFKSLVLLRSTKVFYSYKRHLKVPKGQAPKRALLAYIVDPIHKEKFIGNLKFYFSNNGAPLCMLQALNELGYIVDVIEYNNLKFQPKEKYHLFFFHGYEIYEALKPKLGNNVVSIAFETTAYYKPMLEKIRERITYFKQRHNLNLPEVELNHFLWMEKQANLVDRVSKSANGVIVMGDQLAKSFEVLGSNNVKLIKSAVYQDTVLHKNITPANLHNGRNKFLFFGGGSDVMRKGLDILLDAFIGSPYELYMCINVPPAIEKEYKLSEQKNIHNLGYLKVGSKKFSQIIDLCNFIIQPSAAEGVPGGVLETMKYGLIPVVSKECNIPEAEQVGFMLPDFKVETIKETLKTLAGWKVDDFDRKAMATIETIKENYSPEKFILDIKNSIQEIVAKK